jgi:nucleoside-diphosphate-sugar epimerase
MSMNILVTGASGFLGAHVVKACLDCGLEVSAGIRSDSIAWRLQAITASTHRLDLNLTRPHTIQECLRLSKPDVIIHCAAYGVDFNHQDHSLAFQTNVAGVYHLIAEASACSVSRFIHIGSCFEYGDKDHPVHEDEVLKPYGIYGATKACGSLLALQLGRQFGLPTVVLRPFGLYGPLEASYRFIPQVIRACSIGTPVKLTSGDQIRDYTYVEDVAQAVIELALIKDFPSGEIFNIGSGQASSLRTLGERVSRLLGGHELLLWGALAHRPDEIRMLVSDSMRAAGRIGWSPKTGLEEGIMKTKAEMEERARAGLW